MKCLYILDYLTHLLWPPKNYPWQKKWKGEKHKHKKWVQIQFVQTLDYLTPLGKNTLALPFPKQARKPRSYASSKLRPTYWVADSQGWSVELLNKANKNGKHKKDAKWGQTQCVYTLDHLPSELPQPKIKSKRRNEGRYLDTMCVHLSGWSSHLFCIQIFVNWVLLTYQRVERSEMRADTMCVHLSGWSILLSPATATFLYLFLFYSVTLVWKTSIGSV